MMQTPEIVIITYSVFSMLCSMAVIGTILFFPAMKNGNFMPIILYMSISDVGLNFSTALGFPSTGTVRCWAQGLIQNYFALSGWFWTTILTYRIYCFVRYGRCNLKKRYMHLFSWGLPFILSVLPAITTDYGNDHRDSEGCVYVRRKGTAKWLVTFWGYTTFFGWLFLCVFLMLAWQLVIVMKYRNSPMKGIISRTYNKVYLYPIVMIVCWTLSFWCNALSRDDGELLYTLNVVFGISNGVLDSLIFLFKSEEARRRWQTYLYPPNKRDTFDASVDPEIIRPDFEQDNDDDVIEDFDTQGPQSSMYGMDVEISDITMSDISNRGTQIDNPMQRKITNG